jgi:HK97 family phage portal protein
MAFLDRFRKKAMPVTVNGYEFVSGAMNPLLDKDLAALYHEGYVQNPVVRACVDQIAKGAGNVKLELHRVTKTGKEVITSHPLLNLLERPNPTQSGAGFIQELVTYHRIAGEAFVLRLPKDGKPTEIYNLDPRYVDIKKPDAGVMPKAYTYGTSESKVSYPVNPATGVSQVKHIKTVHPLNPWRGLSPILSCANAVDTHNCGGKWNAALLNNSARPSGIVEVSGAVDPNLVNQLRTWFKSAWQGSSNAGTVPVLAGGAKFTPLSHAPKDMDFQNSMTEAAKQIAMAYGVPLPLVTTEASTYSNVAEAKEMLWADTIIPLLDEVLSALGDFLLPLFEKNPGDYILTFNPDSIPALEAKRTRLYERMTKAVSGGLLTPNEARLEMGFDEQPGGEQLYIPTSLTPISSAGGQTALVKAMSDAGMEPEAIKSVLETQ